MIIYIEFMNFKLFNALNGCVSRLLLLGQIRFTTENVKQSNAQIKVEHTFFFH